MDIFLIVFLLSVGILVVNANIGNPQHETDATVGKYTIMGKEYSAKVKRQTTLREKYSSKQTTPELLRTTSGGKEFAEEERAQVCFGELGCFSNGDPFDYPGTERLISLLPETPEEIGTVFRFYAFKRNGFGQFITNRNFSDWDVGSEYSGFVVNQKTKFIIHGYLGGDAEWAWRMKQALIYAEKCNVFIVDWSDGDGILYEQAVANVRVVGAEVGLFIKKLMIATNMQPHMVHIIGHSLGAHGAGYAGKFIQKNVPNAKIGRITGLDPAGPYFEGVKAEVRLDIGDAKFVDVIHTNWAEHRLSGFGIEEPLGHFDFYPTGGEDQPGCPTAMSSAWDIATDVLSCMNLPCLIYQATSEEPFESLVEKVNDVSCSHGRAYEYFIESIMDRSCEFRSQECPSYRHLEAGLCPDCLEQKCIQMGYWADRFERYAKDGVHKKLYLRVIKYPPYCIEKTQHGYLVNAHFVE